LLAGSLADALEQLAAAEAERNEPLPTFREFLESPDFAGPYMAKVGISPIMGAIVDASEGSPVETIDDELAIKVFHLHLDELPLGDAPRVVALQAGRQCGKTSNALAPKAVHAAWTQPAPKLRPGQVARCVIISPRTDLSRAAFRYCKGIVESSPRMSRNIEKITSGNLADVSAEIIVLRRPDGHLVEIVVGPADGGGTAARSATLLFCGLDEAAFFFADDGHTVNDRAIFDAAMGTLRTLDGAQLWITSTPWIEGSGLLEELIAEYWGTRGGVLVAARLSSYEMRGIPDDGRLREDTDTEETYRREVLCQPLPAGSAGFFSAVELANALLREPPARAPEQLGAGGDFAFERDAAAAVVCARYLGGIFAPTLVEERHATPDDLEAATVTVRELGMLVAQAGVNQIMGDHWKRTFVREHLHAARVAFVDAPGSDEGKARTYGAAKRVIDEGRLALGALPRRVAEYVRDQLRAVVATPIAGPGARFRISSPRHSRLLEGVGAAKIGSHGDVAGALVLAMWQAGGGREAASWQVPRAGQPAARETRQAPPARSGAGSSAGFLRERSAGVRRGRGGPSRPDDDD
jgi:hypothetical protein